jgi:arabinogalactan endo-1,4-beta-galactosidase
MYKDLLVIMGLCIVVASAFAAEDSPAVGALLYGGDISMLPRFEELGAVYRDNGKPAEAFRKGIVVVETAYPWRKDTEGKNMAWPQTPQGQKQFLEDAIQAVRSTPHGIGKGVLWRHPELIPIKGLEVWKGGNAALFDAEGSALPALDAFQTE